MKCKKIKTNIDKMGNINDPLQLGGWFQGTLSYLWFGIENRCVGVLSGQKLYRLCKAIVKQFEMEK